MLKILAIVLLLSGCVSNVSSTGAEIDRNVVDSFVDGKTLESEVVALMGKPISIKDSSDGTRTLMYYRMNSQVDGSVYFGMTSNMDMTVVTFIFGKDKKLASHETTVSKYTR